MDAASNTSALSAPLTATTARDVTAPTVPGALRVTATTASSVSLAWGASSDRWALWYEVLMDGASRRLLRRRDPALGRGAAANSSAPSNPATLTVVADPNLC